MATKKGRPEGNSVDGNLTREEFEAIVRKVFEGGKTLNSLQLITEFEKAGISYAEAVNNYMHWLTPMVEDRTFYWLKGTKPDPKP